MYDIIGDIHGHADELKALLKKLGYNQRNSTYGHPDRKVLFLGDYIDRGPQIVEALEIVRGMVETGDATALMGNHEFNAICWAAPDGRGGYLRAHDEKNLRQHGATLKAFEHDPERWADHLRWFRSLPLFWEADGLRAVHASWDPAHLAVIAEALDGAPMSDDFLANASRKGTGLHQAVEAVLKGKELRLPPGHGFTDKDGHLREEVRIRWWEDPRGATYRAFSLPYRDDVPDTEVPIEMTSDAWHYPEVDRPVFFGHYWLQHPHPAIMRSNICCLDFSVAKEGALMAYRYDGEQELDHGKLVWEMAVDAAGSTA